MKPVKNDLDAFLRILDLEGSRGYPDTAVLGGLDRYIQRQLSPAGGQRDASPMARLVNPGFRYASLTPEQRRKWVEKVRQQAAGHTPAAERPAAAPPGGAPRPPDIPVPKPPPGLTLDSPITSVSGIGPSMAAKFARLDVRTIRDILYLFPRRHLDYGNQKRVSELEPGAEQTLVATVWEARQVNLGGRPGSEATLGDESGTVRAVWFNQPYLAKRFRTNTRLVLYGRVNLYKGKMVFESPAWEFLESGSQPRPGMLIPVYPLTEGLYPRHVRQLMKGLVAAWAPLVPDHLPAEIIRRCALLPLSQAIAQAHFPDSPESQKEARQRLAFDELFLIQAGVARRKLEWQGTEASARLKTDKALLAQFTAGLPFRFTRAQDRALQEILADIGRARPMSRLLQGDVGSGKTVVATAALVTAAANGCQGALMAPTEILAEQHFNTISGILSRLGGATSGEPAGGVREFPSLSPHPFRMALLTGGLKAGPKREIQKMAASGEVHLLVGTHALIQKGIEFGRLGLAVVDEQHRFGVEQRLTLRQKGKNPHVLVMTATPIPRTLALTLYGDLDISVIDELPPGRVAIETRWLEPSQRQAAYDFVRRQVGKSRQAFVVCPLIEESEAIEAKAAVAEYHRLSQQVFPELRLGLLHGRMAAAEKESVMRSFKDRGLDILVSTPVVEVGIDVPNAVVMLIEGADRFGLSQLHQFRGRVGRGDHKSYCLLLAESPSFEGRERLRIIERTRDGFRLAEEDLRLRGPGEFFGTHQSGMPDLQMAKLSDISLMERARGEAMRLLQGDPGLERPEHRLLAAELARVWHPAGDSG